MNKLFHGDCLHVLKEMPDNSVDSIVTDPPYGLSFMGRKWDYDVPSVEVWQECLRVLKPGGHLLSFAGTRTQHRMAARIEDAGFEIRDMIAWVYGSGFPKSLDVSKAIDKAEGAEREVTREGQTKASEDAGKFDSAPSTARERRDNPATEAARQWQGWGTALKLALEPLTVARKPFKGTVAANVMEHGTGAINVDGCRVGDEVIKTNGKGSATGSTPIVPLGVHYEGGEHVGRWPANLIHDGSEEPTGLLGDAARFFYCAKASKRDRDEGLEHMPRRENANWPQSMDGNDKRGAAPRANTHPTVKPTELMRYLCRLVTPPGGVVLDPFMGSGSTGKAAALEGFRFIGIEREAEYLEIARARIQGAA